MSKRELSILLMGMVEGMELIATRLDAEAGIASKNFVTTLRAVIQRN